MGCLSCEVRMTHVLGQRTSRTRPFTYGWLGWMRLRYVISQVQAHARTVVLSMCVQAGHFGRSAQPFSGESLAWLKNQVENKFVYCQLIRRDQYGRIVSAVTGIRRSPPELTPLAGCSSAPEAAVPSRAVRNRQEPPTGDAAGRLGLCVRASRGGIRSARLGRVLARAVGSTVSPFV